MKKLRLTINWIAIFTSPIWITLFGVFIGIFVIYNTLRDYYCNPKYAYISRQFKHGDEWFFE